MNSEIEGQVEADAPSLPIAVLLVDDESMVLHSLREQIRRLVSGSDITVECATSAAEAWEVIGELAIDGVRLVLVVSDWLMPQTRGDIFLAEVQAKYPNIKRVLLTGQADHDVVSRAVGGGLVDQLIYKPWSEQDLRDAVGLVVRPDAFRVG